MAKFNRIAILFIVILQVSFFSMMTTTSSLFLINSYVYKTLTIFLITCLLLFNLIFNFNKANQIRKYHFLIMIFGWIVIYIITMWGSVLYYDQSILTTIKNSYIYIMIVLYFLLVLFFDSNKDFKFILSSFSFIGAIYSVILIIQAILEKRNIIFLDFGIYGLNPIFDSFGPMLHLIRIAGPADFISFALLLTVIKQIYFKNKHQLINFLCIIIDFLYIVFVSGTRMYMILDFVIIVFFFLTLLKKRFPALMYGILSVSLVLSTIVVPVIINLFTSGERKLSFDIRLNEIKYYFGKIFYNNWFGIGFPDAKKYDQLLHGPNNSYVYMSNGKYFVEDVGAMGIVVVFGILGIIGLLWFAYKVITALIISKNRDIMLVIILYLLMTIATLSLVDPQRIFYLFVLIYIMEFIVKKIPYKNLEESQ
ncbi:hypothetical protein RD055328_10840 [Companilactobacillus sp. RD055328]|uniref:O-antigen ligase family protein n=1 Tax=Companilactobacillus sp. RD055328 TaxID=2916634 RepID=UPI001FC82F8D|nr:O-antigen ligase family protein [Companilactobacillus sp. RD055328]GKQ43161.1 hypothetical protein RD055328_10840 [Companilactobacillus sp. RD055328]